MGTSAKEAWPVRCVVSDTGPLLHLGEIEILELLSLTGKAHVPRGVQTEVMLRTGGRLLPPWVRTDSLDDMHEAEALDWHPAGLLDIGEAEAIALARPLRADWFLTDDAAARIVAKAAGFEVHGSLGVLLWAAARGHMNRIDAGAASDRLARSSLWVYARVFPEAGSALDKLFET